MKNIDSLDQIDISKLTFSDMRVKFGTFRCTSTGRGHEKKYSCRRGYQTELGDIQDKIWKQLAKHLIDKVGETEIFDRLLEHVESFAWLKNEPRSECIARALELHMCRIFDDPKWVNFIPFNETFRPEAFSGVKIIEIIPSCCQKSGRVTIQQIDQGKTKVYCPHCGRLSTYKFF